MGQRQRRGGEPGDGASLARRRGDGKRRVGESGGGAVGLRRSGGALWPRCSSSWRVGSSGGRYRRLLVASSSGGVHATVWQVAGCWWWAASVLGELELVLGVLKPSLTHFLSSNHFHQSYCYVAHKVIWVV